MGAEESTMGGRGGRPKGPAPSRFDVIKMKVVPYLVSVTHDVEPTSVELCRLPRGTIIEVVEEKVSRNGTTRVMITDPIWKGWISLRAPSGELDLEPTDAIQAEKLMARSGAAALQSLPLREPDEHSALVAELQAEFFAEDVVPPMGSASWTEDEMREFFDSGGQKLPPGFHIPAAAAKLGLKPPPAAAAGGAADASGGGDDAASGGAASGAAASGAAASGAAASGGAANEPMSEEEKRDRDTGKWARGTIVVINGVEKTRELNGRSGAIVLYDSAQMRYEVRLADRAVRLKPEALQLHPKQRAKNTSGKGDELVFLTEDEKLAREGMYAVRMDPQFWYDQALDRVFAATNEFEVLGLEVAYTEDLNVIKRAYRKTSLHVHPDKNKHPQADAGFRKVYGAFETLSDLQQQKRLLWELGNKDFSFSEAEAAGYAAQPGEDDDDYFFQWWWEATVDQVEKAAEESEGAEIDHFAEMFISDGLGGDVNDVRWIGLKKARDLFDKSQAIFIDCRADHAFLSGSIPGARNVPMERIGYAGIVDALGKELIHELLSTRRHQLIIVTSQIATPFSRCRAFCRYLLRAGHTTLPAPRFRRLRGGIFGWKHKGGPLTQMLAYHGDETYNQPVPVPMDAASFREAATKAAAGKEGEAEVVD